MNARRAVTIATPAGGWLTPWPSVAEICVALPSENWTLIGALMVQLHAVHHGVAAVRPTNDVDVLLPVETGRGRPGLAVRALTTLGYDLEVPPPRTSTAHRFRRGSDVVDVVIADQAALG